MLNDKFIKLNSAIKESGEILKKYFGKQLELDHKSSSADYRTKADIETEDSIIKAIDQIFPFYNIIAEECGEIQRGSEYTFIIDPLDGTNNFVLGIPAFASSVALMKNGEIIYGVIYCPVTDEIYYAEKGKGSFLNNKPIKVNSENNIKNTTVGYFCNYATPQKQIMEARANLSKAGIRRFLDLWSPAFCYCGLACGRIEALINNKIELYDFAAGKLIASEAGAKITDFSGKSVTDDTLDTFIVTNGTDIHDEIVVSVRS